MFRLMLGKPIWDLSIYIIFGKVIVFRGRFILSQFWIWSLAMFVQSTLIKKSLNISTIEVFNGQCPYLTFNVMNNWSSYITPPAIFSSMVIYCPTQTAYKILRARHTTILPLLSTNTNTKKKQTQTQQKQTQTQAQTSAISPVFFILPCKTLFQMFGIATHTKTLYYNCGWGREKGKQI